MTRRSSPGIVENGAQTHQSDESWPIRRDLRDSRPTRGGWLAAAGPKARYALAAIRVVNGIVALAAPAIIVKRFGEVPGSSAAATYGLRLFGVRTVLIGADLVTQRGQALRHTTTQAVVIHASDTMTAAGLAISGRVRPRLAVPLILISAINTALATISWLATGQQHRP